MRFDPSQIQIQCSKPTKDNTRKLHFARKPQNNYNKNVLVTDDPLRRRFDFGASATVTACIISGHGHNGSVHIARLLQRQPTTTAASDYDRDDIRVIAAIDNNVMRHSDRSAESATTAGIGNYDKCERARSAQGLHRHGVSC